MRLSAAFRLRWFILFAVTFVAAQSTNGTVSGIVLDPSDKAIAGADIEIVNDATGIRYPGEQTSRCWSDPPILGRIGPKILCWLFSRQKPRSTWHS